MPRANKHRIAERALAQRTAQNPMDFFGFNKFKNARLHSPQQQGRTQKYRHYNIKISSGPAVLFLHTARHGTSVTMDPRKCNKQVQSGKGTLNETAPWRQSVNISLSGHHVSQSAMQVSHGKPVGVPWQGFWRFTWRRKSCQEVSCLHS